VKLSDGGKPESKEFVVRVVIDDSSLFANKLVSCSVTLVSTVHGNLVPIGFLHVKSFSMPNVSFQPFKVSLSVLERIEKISRLSSMLPAATSQNFLTLGGLLV